MNILLTFEKKTTMDIKNKDSLIIGLFAGGLAGMATKDSTVVNIVISFVVSILGIIIPILSGINKKTNGTEPKVLKKITKTKSSTTNADSSKVDTEVDTTEETITPIEKEIELEIKLGPLKWICIGMFLGSFIMVSVRFGVNFLSTKYLISGHINVPVGAKDSTAPQPPSINNQYMVEWGANAGQNNNFDKKNICNKVFFDIKNDKKKEAIEKLVELEKNLHPYSYLLLKQRLENAFQKIDSISIDMAKDLYCVMCFEYSKNWE